MKVSVHVCRDQELIARLQLRAAKELPVLDFEPREWWVAKAENSDVAGYAAMRITKDFAWLSACYVFSKFRGAGIQKRLIRCRLIKAKKQGCKSVYTYTANGNHPSQNSLIACGFKTCDPPNRAGGKWADDVDIIYWRKQWKP